MSGKIMKRVATVTVSKWCGHENCNLFGHDEWTLTLNNTTVGVTRCRRVAVAMQVLADSYNESRKRLKAQSAPKAEGGAA